MISFALCLIYMSNNKDDSDSRNFNDGYEYTRLHESILDINTNNQSNYFIFKRELTTALNIQCTLYFS